MTKFLVYSKAMIRFIILFNLYLLTTSNPAVKHNHKHNNNINQERLEDGSFSPRDHGHLGDEGEHHSEFDHEAILGKYKFD